MQRATTLSNAYAIAAAPEFYAQHPRVGAARAVQVKLSGRWVTVAHVLLRLAGSGCAAHTEFPQAVAAEYGGAPVRVTWAHNRQTRAQLMAWFAQAHPAVPLAAPCHCYVCRNTCASDT